MSNTTDQVKQSLARRYRAEKRFRSYGIFAIASSLSFLALLIGSIIIKGTPAFTTTYMKLDVMLDADTLGLDADPSAKELRRADYSAAIKQTMRDKFPDATKRKEKKALYQLVSSGAEYQIAAEVSANPALVGTMQSFWVLADDELSSLIKSGDDLTQPEALQTRMSEQQIGLSLIHI